MDGILRAWPHPAKLPTCKKLHRQQGEAYRNVIQGRVHRRCSQTWQYHPCGVGSRNMKAMLVNGLWSLPPQLHRAADVRCVAGSESLRGIPERPLHEALKVKVGLYWRSQHIEKARDMRYLPKRATDREKNQTKREVFCDH